MYYLLSLLTGILISVMVAFNGGLTGHYGTYSATVVIHITGLLLISILAAINRERPFSNRQKWFLYLGGPIGVLTTIFNNYAFGRISVSAILALGLFGQSVTGGIIDHYGLMGMPKHSFQKNKIFGLILIFGGIAAMMDNFNIAASLMSFAAGVTIVTARTFNAKLAVLTSTNTATVFNYITGLAVAVPVYFLLGGGETPLTAVPVSSNFYIYFGGILGVCVVLLNNITVTKVSAFYLSLFLFIGQIFSGVLIDAVISQALSIRNLTGGILVSAGLCVNLLLDRRRQSGTGKDAYKKTE